MFKPLLLPIALIIFTFFSQNVYSQTKWSDYFSDSNFIANPIWMGDTNDFVVNDSLELQLYAPNVTGTSSIKTTSTAAWNASWKFNIQLDFNPSSNNYAEIFFLTDQNSTQNASGYSIRFGGHSSDKIHFFKNNNGIQIPLWESNTGFLGYNSINVSVEITRDSLGTFSAYFNQNGIIELMDSISDLTYTNSSFFIINCEYTSTRSKKFYFDNFEVNGNVYYDLNPPLVSNIGVISTNELYLIFNENIDSNSTQKLNSFKILSTNSSPTNVEWNRHKKDSLFLSFLHPFLNGKQQLFLENIEDNYDNEINDTIIEFIFHASTPKQVVISEIMFDPSPPVLLPEHDYIEFFNTTKTPINLEGWTLVLPTRSFIFPYYILLPDSFLIIIPKGESLHYLNLPHIESPFPSNFLPLSETKIQLLDQYKSVVDEVNYSNKMYNHSEKDDGGWSLERIDLLLKCNVLENWSASNNSKGGTPGMFNSFNDSGKLAVGYLDQVIYKNEKQVNLHFNTYISQLNVSSTKTIDTVYWHSSEHKELHLLFSESLDSNQITDIYLNDLYNCTNIPGKNETIKLTLPHIAKRNIYLSEAYFNPKDEMQDFVEFYNANPFCISTNQLRLAKVDEIDNSPKDVQLITSDSLLVQPHSYYVITSDKEAILKNYSQAKPSLIIENKGLFNLNYDKGSIGICKASLHWMEFGFYDEKWHHPLIRNPKGVSLERISFNHSATSQENWHSASYGVNYATPTSVNSQYVQGSAAGNIHVAPKVFTPDNNGVDDVIQVTFDLKEPGWVLTLMVYDVYGREIKTLINNKPIGVDEILVWNGLKENGVMAAKATYIIFAQLWHPNGRSLTLKESCRLYYE